MSLSNDSAALHQAGDVSARDAGVLGDGRRFSFRGDDRRAEPTPRFSRYALHGGRRTEVRRKDEREGSFVDFYDKRVLMAIGWIALMNVADSFFTLVHLQHGGIELNPVAAKLLETGRLNFVIFKSLFISAALIVLCMHKNFSLARAGLWISAVAYTALVAYHISLFGV